jgi:hypothetical protein
MSISSLSVIKALERALDEIKWDFSWAEGTKETIIFRLALLGESLPDLILILKGTPLVGTSGKPKAKITRDRGKRVSGIDGWDWRSLIAEIQLFVHYEGLSSREALQKYREETVRIGDNLSDA